MTGLRLFRAWVKRHADALCVALDRQVTVATPTLSLAGWGLSGCQLVGKQAVTFTGSTRFTDLEGVDYLRVFSPQINVPAGAALVADFPTGSRATTFYFDAGEELTFLGEELLNDDAVPPGVHFGG